MAKMEKKWAGDAKWSGDTKWSGDEWSELRLEDLENIAGGARETTTVYYVEGYSTRRKSNITVTVDTYEQALLFCNKYGVDTACISEWVCPY